MYVPLYGDLRKLHAAPFPSNYCLFFGRNKQVFKNLAGGLLALYVVGCLCPGVIRNI